MYIFDCDRIIGDEEKRTIIENMEGKAEVIFDNSEGYDRGYGNSYKYTLCWGIEMWLVWKLL